MKKFYAEAFILSICIGILLRASAFILSGESVFTNIEEYVCSAFIAIISCTVSFLIHVKILTNNRFTFFFKYMISSISILFIYLLGNIYFGGIHIVYEVEFYGYAVVIVLISLPLIYYLNKKVRIYNNYLEMKKSQNNSAR